MKLLITGPMGHIGTHLISNRRLIDKFDKIILVDYFLNNKQNILYRFNYKKKFKFIYRDISKNSLIDLPKVNYCIHLASITNAQESVNIKDKALSKQSWVFQKCFGLLYKTQFKIDTLIVNECIRC